MLFGLLVTSQKCLSTEPNSNFAQPSADQLSISRLLLSSSSALDPLRIHTHHRHSSRQPSRGVARFVLRYRSRLIITLLTKATLNPIQPSANRNFDRPLNRLRSPSAALDSRLSSTPILDLFRLLSTLPTRLAHQALAPNSPNRPSLPPPKRIALIVSIIIASIAT